MRRKTQLIVALDVDSFAKARHFINLLYPKVRIFKVGLQLFTACGPAIINFIQKKGAKVFLDLKLFDIPNTVAHAVREAVKLRVAMLTLHISGAGEMLIAAVKAADEEAKKLKVKRPALIGITVLTSQQVSADKVLTLAKEGLSCGLDGVVCSVREASFLRQEIKKNFLIITPGIRLEKSGKDDQKRVATFKDAVLAGVDFAVMGRPILEAAQPQATVKQLLSD